MPLNVPLPPFKGEAQLPPFKEAQLPPLLLLGMYVDCFLDTYGVAGFL